MPKYILALVALMAVSTQLSGCVVYERPYGNPYHYWYR
jgi:hypothetical protein